MAIFCFTDIEGSTSKWEKHKDAMGQVIQRHNAIMEAAVGASGGRIIKHTGDGIYAIFEENGTDPAAPLSCALNIQTAIQSEHWPEIGELRVRMAFHRGEAENLNGDYFGPVANRTARFLGMGWGGQILVSEDLKKMGALPEGAELVDLGVHQVKDLPEPQQVYGLLHPGLKIREFPALKSLSAQPHNLPEQLTPFLGREEELAKLALLLAAANSRLVTVHGAGGMGKSRLAIQAGAEALKGFKHGVTFVELTALKSPAAIVPAIAAALRLTFYSGDEPKGQLLEYLREREMLLILDNFDHLLSGAELILEILRACPKVRVLASSREKLNHHSETVFEIQGLKLPDEAGLTLEASSAAHLFAARARKVKADFAVKPEDRSALARICRKVGGMPLAIEIAAAWAKTLPMKEIARRVESNLGVLVSAEKDLPERHRSLRAVFDYSWKLLNAVEQRWLQDLSAFSGDFSPEAALEVTQCNHANLDRLVNKSLLWVGEAGRYGMPESLRLFAAAKLDLVPPEKEKVLGLHARHYMGFLKQREAALKGLGQAAALKALEAEWDNLRQAWKWALGKADAGLLTQGARALGIAAEIKGPPDEWLAAFEKALALWDGSEMRRFETASMEESVQGFAALNSVAALLRLQAGLATAAEAGLALQKSAQIFKRTQRKDEAAYCLVRAALSHPALNGAAAGLNEAVLIYRQAADRNGEAWAKACLGALQWESGRSAEAKRAVSEGLAVFKELGNQREAGLSLAVLGGMALREGQVAAGIQLTQEAKVLLLNLGDPMSAGWVLLGLGNSFVHGRAWAEALPFMAEALALFKGASYSRGIQTASKSLSEIYWILGDLKNALLLADEALANLDALKDGGRQKAKALLDKAEIVARQGSFEPALSLCNEGQLLMQTAKSLGGSAEATEIQAGILLQMGEAAKAREGFKKANQDFRQAGPEWRIREAWTYVKIAEAELALGRSQEAMRNYSRALSMAEAPRPEDHTVAALQGLALVQSKEKKNLEALRLLLVCERLIQDEKLMVGAFHNFEKSRLEAETLLAELSSKLMQSMFEDTRAWAKSAALGPFYKETTAKLGV